MNAHGTRPTPAASASVAPQTEETHWHCRHYFYSFDRRELARLAPHERQQATQEFSTLLANRGDRTVRQMQAFVVSGHKADFGLMVLDEDPWQVDSIHQRLLASAMGQVLRPEYSFVSVTEVSEYLPTTPQYAERLIAEGMTPDSEQYQARVRAYAEREPAMRRERLTPELPDWPALCFYPMNKKRDPDANWFMLELAERQRMMSEHARSGMAFSGRVTQLITTSIGLDDWEWGVTLWAKRGEYLKDIVYQMRFDEASARYAEFGRFYAGYQASPVEILHHCRVAATNLEV